MFLPQTAEFEVTVLDSAKFSVSWKSIFEVEIQMETLTNSQWNYKRPIEMILWVSDNNIFKGLSDYSKILKRGSVRRQYRSREAIH